MAVQFLELLTPARVVVADLSPDKRATALDLGADAAVDPCAPDAAEAAAGRDRTAGAPRR